MIILFDITIPTPVLTRTMELWKFICKGKQGLTLSCIDNGEYAFPSSFFVIVVVVVMAFGEIRAQLLWDTNEYDFDCSCGSFSFTCLVFQLALSTSYPLYCCYFYPCYFSSFLFNSLAIILYIMVVSCSPSKLPTIKGVDIFQSCVLLPPPSSHFLDSGE